MRKTIDGIRYDTDTARVLGEAKQLTLHWWTAWQATLYRTPRAENYFLIGSGGPMTIFGKGFTKGVQERFLPLTKAEAEAWAQQFIGGLPRE